MMVKRAVSNCLLMGLDGVTYQALLGGLSLSGVEIDIGDNVSHGLNVGDICGLIYSDKPEQSPTKHTGMIAKLDSSGSIRISFNHQEHRHQKNKCSPFKGNKIARNIEPEATLQTLPL